MKILKIAAVLMAVQTLLISAAADENNGVAQKNVTVVQGREYVEIDGKPYLRDSDGNYIGIEIKAPPVDEARKSRPARGRKYGAPHSSTWRVDEDKEAVVEAREEKTAPAKEAAAEEKIEIDCKLVFGGSAVADAQEAVGNRALSYSAKTERIEKLADGKYAFVLVFKASVAFVGSPDRISVEGVRACVAERGVSSRVHLLSIPNPQGENSDLQAVLAIRACAD